MKVSPLWIVPISVVAMASIGVYRGSAKRKAPVWTHDLNKAIAEAKATNKLILIDFNASWCKPCKAYRDEVFPTGEFSDQAQDVVLVDIDVEKRQDIAYQYRVYELPDLRVIGPNGTEYGKVVGYEGPEPLYDALALARSLR